MKDKEAAIRQKAYELWEKAGRPHGRDEEHWHQAAAEIGKTVAEKSAAAPTPTPPGLMAAAPAPAKAKPVKPVKTAAAMATPSPVRRKK